MDEYFPKVLFGVQKLWSRPDGYRDLQLTCDRLDMEPQQALSVTVIAIELITNSCKYAYPAQSRGVVGITLLKNGVERFELTVTDKGMGKQARIRSPGGGLGALIIAKMVQSMRALMTESSSSEGTTVTISGSCYKPNT
jgi:two-component sensor histidine kinase